MILKLSFFFAPVSLKSQAAFRQRIKNQLHFLTEDIILYVAVVRSGGASGVGRTAANACK